MAPERTIAQARAGLFDPADRRSGLAAEAYALILDILFDALGVERVSSLVRPDNVASVRFWMGLEFRVEDVRDDPAPPPGAPPILLAIGLSARTSTRPRSCGG